MSVGRCGNCLARWGSVGVGGGWVGVGGGEWGSVVAGGGEWGTVGMGARFSKAHRYYLFEERKNVSHFRIINLPISMLLFLIPLQCYKIMIVFIVCLRLCGTVWKVGSMHVFGRWYEFENNLYLIFFSIFRIKCCILISIYTSACACACVYFPDENLEDNSCFSSVYVSVRACFHTCFEGSCVVFVCVPVCVYRGVGGVGVGSNAMSYTDECELEVNLEIMMFLIVLFDCFLFGC